MSNPSLAQSALPLALVLLIISQVPAQEQSTPFGPISHADGITEADSITGRGSMELTSCDLDQAACEESCGLGLIAKSDAQFCRFVSPVTNPLFFEDPRTLTEIRPIFASHFIPSNNPVFQGGNVQYFATQARIALTENLSIIATKDGYIWIEGENDAIPDTDGWADVAAGLKLNLFKDADSQMLLSAGLTYEMDAGEHKVFQGRGDGEFHIFATGGAEVFSRGHWLTASGFRIPTDRDDRSQMWYWSNHWDYEVVDTWYGLFELNWFHWMNSGRALPVSFEGGDLFNLGSTSVTGNDIVTAGIGAKKRFGQMHEIGVGYEVPVTERKDLLQSRIYVDLILRY